MEFKGLSDSKGLADMGGHGKKKKSNLLLIGGGIFVLLFIFMYLRQSKQESGTLSLQGAYASYPDSVTNANVIIDSLQQSIDYQTEEIADMLGDMNEGMHDRFDNLSENMHDRFDSTNERIDGLEENMHDRFDATNDFINDGFESLKDINDTNLDTILGAIDDANNSIMNGIGGVSDSLTHYETGYVDGIIRNDTQPTVTEEPIEIGWGNLNTDYNEAINSQKKEPIKELNKINPAPDNVIEIKKPSEPVNSVFGNVLNKTNPVLDNVIGIKTPVNNGFVDVMKRG